MTKDAAVFFMPYSIMRLTGAALMIISLTNCGEENISDAAQDAADVAEIRAIHDTTPIQPITPERISYSDVEENNLFGVSCGFAPGEGMAVMMMAMSDRAYMKLDNKIVSFAADKGSTSLPTGAWTKYDGREYAIRIAEPNGEGNQDGISTVSWKGSVAVLDGQNRSVYEANGTLQCGS